MKVKIALTTVDTSGGKIGMRHSVVWEGELSILRDTEYLTKITLIGEGEPQPLCDIPFAIGIGHYLWIPPDPAFLEEIDYTYHTEEGNGNAAITEPN